MKSNSAKQNFGGKKKVTATDSAAVNTKDLLKKAQNRETNADIPPSSKQSDAHNDGPLNLQVGSKPSGAGRHRRHWENPSQNADESRETRREKFFPGVN